MRMLSKKIRTVFDLGIIECLTVILYRVMIKLSIHPVCFIKGDIPSGPFFRKSRLPPSGLTAVSNWDNACNLFSHINIPLINEPPNWLDNPISGGKLNSGMEHWWKISDFDDLTGDIKLVWEQSRMNWVIAFAQRARNGDEGSLQRLNLWLSDWSESNPPYFGPNWKCGQEASIRLIHLCCAALILGQERDTLCSLQQLVRLHLRRIAPTIHYAIAQNNNHGTSEAAALFIGGSWLNSLGVADGTRYEKLGRRWLENRADKLIALDGSFSQYSLNYHRMVVDTFSMAEVWRKHLKDEDFSSAFYSSAARTTSWLYQMICPRSGYGPNIGANDGSLLLQLTDSPYRDYRPCIQLASTLFESQRAYSEKGLWDLQLAWLGVVDKKAMPPQYVQCNYDNGGYKILRAGSANVIFRYPLFRFRPSQADALHVDLWVNGRNTLYDSGTYSYNSKPDMSGYFNGTASHNTIQFDDRDQMPKLGRFLFGSWLKTKQASPILISNDQVSCSASYCDYEGAEHLRQITLSNTRLKVFDIVKGFERKAVIRWRLQDSEWLLGNTPNGVQVSNGVETLSVTSNVAIIRAVIVDGWVSHLYMQKQPCPVLEVEIDTKGTLSTEFRWSS